MKTEKILELIVGENWYGVCGINEKSSRRYYQRLALTAGVDVDAQEITPAEAQKIAQLHYTEHQMGSLVAFGREMAKINVSIPSNINVWQHVRGESVLRAAAENLTSAVEALARR